MTASAATSNALCVGAKAIADQIGVSRRQVYNLADIGVLPHFRLGRLLCARKAALQAWMAEQEEHAARAVRDVSEPA